MSERDSASSAGKGSANALGNAKEWQDGEADES
jgi:hypothetical protein